MRKTIFSCALLLGVSGACAVVGAGCSDEAGSGTDSPDSSTGTTDASHDSSTGHVDSSVPDAGQTDSGSADADAGSPPHDSGADTGSNDAASDGSANDAATDAGHDGATDSGSNDAGTDGATNDGGGQDAGTDGSSTDAGSDASPSDGGGADAADASGNAFDNPVQIDVTSVLTANTVVTTTPLNGFTLTSMDKTNYDFLTNSKAQQLSVTGAGLPDDASFGAVAGVHPKVKLHWSNTLNQLNSRVVMDSTPFTFAVPQANYSQVQIYGLSTEGSTTINVLVTYADNSTNGTGVTLAISDWFNDPSVDQFALIDNLDRIQGGTVLDAVKNPGIFGSNLNPDTTKAVKQITVTNKGTGYFVFYGAVAW